MSPHGTYSRYTVGGCRCEKCKAAKAEYQRTRREHIRRVSNMGNSNKRYTQEEVDLMVRMRYEEGASIRDIACMLGRSGEAVEQKLWNLNRQNLERMRTCQSTE